MMPDCGSTDGRQLPRRTAAGDGALSRSGFAERSGILIGLAHSGTPTVAVNHGFSDVVTSSVERLSGGIRE